MNRKHLALGTAVLVAALIAYCVYSASRSPSSLTPDGRPRSAISPPTTTAQPAYGRPVKTSDCHVNESLPDPECTPGDIIAAETKDVICDPDFRTSTVRDTVTTPAEKRRAYAMYDLPHPAHNQGARQVCEIDHLVPLELGGNDTMANLWPECSPGYAGWTGAGFRDKDGFENHLRRQVCAGNISLAEAQSQIATDWHKHWVDAGRPRR
jgi:hypothetical protein